MRFLNRPKILTASRYNEKLPISFRSVLYYYYLYYLFISIRYYQNFSEKIDVQYTTVYSIHMNMSN